MRGIPSLAASIVILACIGGIYAWSVLAGALQARWGLNSGATGLVFGLTFLSFTTTMVLAGRVPASYGPRPSVIAGGLCYGAGYLIASFSGGSLLVLLLSISLLSGLGIGLVYGSVLPVGAHWYPRRRGLVTGLAVAGFGAGSVVLSQAAEWFLESGWGVEAVLRLVGITSSGLIVLYGMILRDPPGAGSGGGVAAADSPVRGPWREPRFWRLAAGMFAGSYGGLIVIGHLKGIGLEAGLSPWRAAQAVSWLAAGNVLGRVVWGVLHDRLGRATVPGSLVLLAAAMLAMPRVSSEAGFLAVSALIGFGFGACFVLYFLETVAHFGADAPRRVYPLIFWAYGLSGALGPASGGWLRDMAGSFAPMLLLAAAVTLAGSVAVSGWPRRSPRQSVGPPSASGPFLRRLFRSPGLSRGRR